MPTREINNNIIIDSYEAISLPHGSGFTAHGNLIVKSTRAIHERDPQTLYETLGLPDAAPPVLVLEALKILNDNRALDVTAKSELLQGSTLFHWLREWLGAGADLVQIAGAFVNLDQQSLVQSAIDFVQKFIGRG